jgi:hypothetical protein
MLLNLPYEPEPVLVPRLVQVQVKTAAVLHVNDCRARRYHGARRGSTMERLGTGAAIVATVLLSCCSAVLGQEHPLPAPELPAAEYAADGDAAFITDVAPTSAPVAEGPLEEIAWQEQALSDRETAEADAAAANDQQEFSGMPRRFRYGVSIETRGVFDDNVGLVGDRIEDFYFQISPVGRFGLGDVLQRSEDYIALSYSPSFYVFTGNSDFNTTEHIGRFDGRWRLSRLALMLSQDVQSVQSSRLDVPSAAGDLANQVNLDIAGRRRVNTYATNLEAEYDFSDKTALRGELQYISRGSSGLIGSETIAATAGVDYNFSQKLRFGLAGRAGKQYVDAPSPDQSFQQAYLRFSYDMAGKLQLSGSGGAEFRQSEAREGTYSSPIFQASLVYDPFDGTELRLNAVRRIFNSVSAFGRDFASTQVVLTGRQRLVQRVFVSMQAGYQQQSYFSTIAGLAVERKDDYYFVAPAVDVRITRYLSAGVYFLYRENSSSEGFYDFENTQLGVRANVQF